MARPENDVAPPNRERYTLDGGETVEARIARDQALIGAAVQEVLGPPEFRALVLMGGYGRGEGGYVCRDGQPEAYNDYDYFVVVRGLSRARRNALSEALAERARDLEHQVGVEVDFALLSDDRLPHAEYSLMNAEMIWGHRVVAGDLDVLDAMPLMPFGSLPLGEFTRLLLNRGALLLMNQRRLADGTSLRPQAQEVFFKYLFKAVLACGDARLAGEHVYHPSYVKKLELLESIVWDGKSDLMDCYRQAWENKFHPDYGRYVGEDSEGWQERVVRLWLDTLAWFEGCRTGKNVGDWISYCSPSVPKGQGRTSWGALRNAAITLRDFGPTEVLKRPRWALRYPRERLISVLPLLLSHRGESRISGIAGALAVATGASRTDAADRFLQLWRRYA
jgi:hypothetical protein